MTTNQKIEQLILALTRQYSGEKVSVRNSNKNLKLINTLSTELCGELLSDYPWDVVRWCEGQAPLTQSQISKTWQDACLASGVEQLKNNQKKEDKMDTKNGGEPQTLMQVTGWSKEVIVVAETLDQLVRDGMTIREAMIAMVKQMNEETSKIQQLNEANDLLKELGFDRKVSNETKMGLMSNITNPTSISLDVWVKAGTIPNENRERFYLALIKHIKQNTKWTVGRSRTGNTINIFGFFEEESDDGVEPIL